MKNIYSVCDYNLYISPPTYLILNDEKFWQVSAFPKLVNKYLDYFVYSARTTLPKMFPRISRGVGYAWRSISANRYLKNKIIVRRLYLVSPTWGGNRIRTTTSYVASAAAKIDFMKFTEGPPHATCIQEV